MNLYQSRAWSRLSKMVVSENAEETITYQELRDLMTSIASDEFTKKETGKDVANVVVSFVNSFSPDTEGFVEEITQRTHRTLQQNTFRLFKKTIESWADKNENEQYYDHRNEATVKQSAKMIEVTKEDYLPQY